MTLTMQAVAQMREVGQFIANNAESLVGDMDGAFVVDTGFHVSFDVLAKDSIPTVKVTKEHIAWNKTA